MMKAGGDTYEKENDFIAAGPGIIVQRCCLRANEYGAGDLSGMASVTASATVSAVQTPT